MLVNRCVGLWTRSLDMKIPLPGIRSGVHHRFVCFGCHGSHPLVYLVAARLPCCFFPSKVQILSQKLRLPALLWAGPVFGMRVSLKGAVWPHPRGFKHWPGGKHLSSTEPCKLDDVRPNGSKWIHVCSSQCFFTALWMLHDRTCQPAKG